MLARLKFDGYTVAQACFGLGMVLLGFVVSAYVFLLLGRMTYTPLGHVGRKQRGWKDEDVDAGAAAGAKVPPVMSTDVGLARTASFHQGGGKV